MLGKRCPKVGTLWRYINPNISIHKIFPTCLVLKSNKKGIKVICIVAGDSSAWYVGATFDINPAEGFYHSWIQILAKK